MHQWKHASMFCKTEWQNSSGEMQIPWKMLRFAKLYRIQNDSELLKSQLTDSLLFRNLYFQSPDNHTETLNHVTLICLTCKEWVWQVRYHPAGNQPFLSSGDIVNLKQESFPFMVGEGHKIQTTSRLCSHLTKRASKSTT